MFGINASFEDVEQYPSVEEKAARLCYALVNNHAFVDGNKRVGVLAMLVTLKLNSTTLGHTQQELIDLGLAAARGKAEHKQILLWIRLHKNQP